MNILDQWFSGFPGGSAVKNPPASAGDAGDKGLISGLERSPGVGNGNPFQYSCLKRSVDTEEPGELQSMGSHRVSHDWAHMYHLCFSTQDNFAFQGAFSNIWRHSSHTWRKGATHIFRVEANDTAKHPTTHLNSPPRPKMTWPQSLCTVGGNVDWCSHCGKQYEVTSKN